MYFNFDTSLTIRNIEIYGGDLDNDCIGEDYCDYCANITCEDGVCLNDRN